MRLVALKTLAALQRAAFLLGPYLPYLASDWRNVVLLAVRSVGALVIDDEENYR